MSSASQSSGQPAMPVLDAETIRADFPILEENVHSSPLIYFDNAATTQKPQAVMDTIQDYYAHKNAAVHRGVHTLSELATAEYERARLAVATFLGAEEKGEIVFTRGATEAINLVAQTYGRNMLGPGDEILVTEMEHHSNIVPWQMLCEQTGAKLAVAPVDDNGEIMVEEFERLLNPLTKIVAITHVSNVLGTVNSIRELADLAHAAGAAVLVDGAQSVPHMRVNVKELDCDFFVCSGHKMYGPTGIGALYGRKDLLDAMPPYQGGGEMILDVTFEKTKYNIVPHKFEAGTPNIEGAIGFAAAVKYLTDIGMATIAAYEQHLFAYCSAALEDVEGLHILGNAENRAAVLSFTMDSAHAHDVAHLLDGEGVAIRGGHHCAQPLMTRFGVEATSRVALGLYNTREEVDYLVRALHKVNETFA